MFTDPNQLPTNHPEELAILPDNLYIEVCKSPGAERIRASNSTTGKASTEERVRTSESTGKLNVYLLQQLMSKPTIATLWLSIRKCYHLRPGTALRLRR